MSLHPLFALSPNMNHNFVPPIQLCPNFSCIKRNMFVQCSSSPSPNINEHFVQNANPKINRRSANFHPSIWGDRFITSAPDDKMKDACLQQQVEELKEVKRMLMDDANEPMKKLKLIDSLQRLGVAYHFEEEIEEALEQIQDEAPKGFEGNDNLYTVSLWFRLLRQQGYNVPCEVFNIFKDSDGSFKEDIINNMNGMLCLYEATHLRVHGENILDEALEFTIARLKSVITDLKPPLSTQVMHALKQPLHKGLPRLEARHYISIYEEDETKNEYLLKFAKLDFNLLQSIHLQELSQLSRWWKELGVVSKLPYARDRLVECYYWMMGVYFEPHYALARKFITKVIALASIIDDTYDVYGTLEELKVFTNAIERWDLSLIDQLPEYMKVLYSAILDVYREIEEELRKEGRSYRVNYAKEAMKALVKAYFIEAKWFNEGYIPAFEEYMENGLNTSGVTMLTVTSLVGMGDVVTKEALDWAMNESNKLVKATSLIGRLMDDMVSHKFEQERGHVCSAVECYMKQYEVSEQEVRDEFNRRLEDAWKDANQAFLKPTAVPMAVLLRCVNLARVVDTTYKYEDGYTLAHQLLKDSVISLLVDPI